MDFAVTIADEHKLAGIAAARNAYNEAQAAADPKFVPLDDAAYVQFVMDGAAQSYANQYKV